ncbi:hypothetical protein ACFC5X_05030 [Streptomyces sp. NPDC055952]|uniref:SCO2400 family protein n=1 Tax=Streptomyces sp. NPDC055952 TaxID=3345663 RepID=UPI0035DA1A79
MDYCSSCCRHLNGALVCPGCGAYAPDIDPCGIGGRAPASSTVPTVWGTAAGPRYDATVPCPAAPDLPEPADLHPDVGPYAGAAGQPPTEQPVAAGPVAAGPVPDEPEVAEPGAADGRTGRPQGRAARRRQMARWKKNQRRAVVATAVALVGGGLTVAAVHGNGTPGVQAATTPGDTPMGGAGAQAPDADGPDRGRYDTPRSAPSAAPQTPRASRHQQARAADPRTTPAGTHTDAATAPRELPLTTPARTGATAPGTAGSAPGDSGTTTPGAASPAAPPAAGTEPGQPESPATPPPAADPAAPATPPGDTGSAPRSDALCLLVICLG